MKLIKELREDVAILTLKGDFDSFVCAPFMEQVNAIFSEGINSLIVDLRLILFINSTGIGTLIKAHKEAQKNGGDLVLSRPSNFVTGVLETLGLTSLFKIYDDPEKAVADLGASHDGADLGADSSVIIDVPGGGKEKCVGKIVVLEEEAITISVPEPRDDLAVGADVKLKFRLPLFMKAHYFDAGGTITEAVHSASGVKIKADLKSMADEDRKSIAQFVQEMKYLRHEARRGS